MMFFAPRAELAKIRKEAPPPAALATSATQATQNPPHVAKVAGVAASQRQNEKIAPGVMRHGHALNGHPKTWTGNIVSLDAWRQLSDWEKPGPDGRHWSGLTKSWEAQT